MSAASTAAGFRLFRSEALEAQREALLGRILINAPLTHWLVAAIAAALVAVLFTFLWFAHDTPRIHAQGALIAATSLVLACPAFDAQSLVPAGAIAAVQPGQPVRQASTARASSMPRRQSFTFDLRAKAEFL